MEWEKQKFLMELELKKLEIEKEKILKWIGFLQTNSIIALSATASIFYKNQGTIDRWIIAGAAGFVFLLFELLLNYRKLDRLKIELDVLRSQL